MSESPIHWNQLKGKNFPISLVMFYSGDGIVLDLAHEMVGESKSGKPRIRAIKFAREYVIEWLGDLVFSKIAVEKVSITFKVLFEADFCYGKMNNMNPVIKTYKLRDEEVIRLYDFGLTREDLTELSDDA